MQRYVLLFCERINSEGDKAMWSYFFSVSYYVACYYFRCKREIEDERKENSFQ